MESCSKLKYIRISAQKARLVADQVRGLTIKSALNILNFSKKKCARFIKALLYSAISNAEHNKDMDIDMLYISKIYVDVGPTTKRFRARAKGRGNKILKRTSHITLQVTEKKY